jgi:DNA polymerase-1
MIKAFMNQEDIHRTTAALIFGKSVEAIDDRERRIAKTINFGIIYGMGSFKLSREIGIGFHEAKDFIERYFNVFKGVRDYIEGVKEKARKENCVTTLLGHRRYLKMINSSNRNIREAEERAAVNSVIQGSNADILKKLMIELSCSLDQFQAKMLLQIHDELVFELPGKQVQAFELFLKQKMESVVKLKVPLLVSVHHAENWGDLK